MTRRFTLLAALALMVAVPAAGYRPAIKKTVSDFLKMSAKDTTFCELTGVVCRVRNYDLGRLFINDGTGTVFIYNVFDYPSHRSFNALDVRTGDTLTVRGRRFVYDGRVIEMKNALYVNHSEGPNHRNVIKRDSLDKNPTFRGRGKEEFAKWVSAHLKYPEDALNAYADGSVTVSFTIGMDGTILYPKVVESSYPALNDEVIRVLKSAPKWKPGIVDGHPVRVETQIQAKFILPI